MFTTTNFDTMYNGSWYTICGCGGDLQEWVNGYTDMLNEENIGTPAEWMHFTGAEMNDQYNLAGNNRYPEDLNFLAFSLDNLNTGKLAIFKLQMGDRWFDDIVDNDRRREEN